ncbi:unnamed protein product [Lactuca virosa]|uniref:Secreted protein n=1 Tax=Lactuca virosa TaxID=75947 RepID=A0AAU9PNE6_9ASTR|nr:unnamed protein product [Lactuca virosa]
MVRSRKSLLPSFLTLVALLSSEARYPTKLKLLKQSPDSSCLLDLVSVSVRVLPISSSDKEVKGPILTWGRSRCLNLRGFLCLIIGFKASSHKFNFVPSNPSLYHLRIKMLNLRLRTCLYCLQN